MTVESETITAPEAAESVQPQQVEPQGTNASDDEALGAIWDKTQEASTNEPGQQVERERGPDGKFVAKAKEGEGEQPASQEGEEGAAEAEAGSTAEAGTAAPAHLPQAIKAAWGKIPVEARTAIASHQQEMDRKFSEVGRQLSAVKPIADRFAHVQQNHPEFQGMTPDQMAQGAVELAAVQTRLERGSPEDRTDMILQIAQRYGVLGQIAGKLSGKEPDQNSQVSFLEQKIANLEQQLSKSPQIDEQTIEDRISQAMESRQVQTEVESFAEKADFWADVENVMPGYIQMVRGTNPEIGISQALELAYDMAINADPIVRQKVRELEAKATTKQPDTKRVDAAKKAASINVKSTVNGSGREVSEDDALAMAYDRAAAG